MLNLFGSALVNTTPNRPDIVHLRTQRIKVTTDPPQKIVLDGEIIGTTPVEIECIPEGLSVFVAPMLQPTVSNEPS
jgi:diacylglycerol kinase family enzyme